MRELKWTEAEKKLSRRAFRWHFRPSWSQLISVFGRLIRERRLTEAQLQGLSPDKLEFIRRIAEV